MSLDTRLLSINGGTTIVVFNRTDVLNAIRENMGDEISKYLESEFVHLEDDLDAAYWKCQGLEVELDNAEYVRDVAICEAEALTEQIRQLQKDE